MPSSCLLPHAILGCQGLWLQNLEPGAVLQSTSMAGCLISHPSLAQAVATARAWQGCRSCGSRGRAAWPRGTRWPWSAEPSATPRPSTSGSGIGSPWKGHRHPSSRYGGTSGMAQHGTAWHSMAQCSVVWHTAPASCSALRQVKLVTTAERGSYSCHVFNLFHEVWSQEVNVEIGEGPRQTSVTPHLLCSQQSSHGCTVFGETAAHVGS